MNASTRRNLEIIVTSRQICQLLNWTEEQLFDFKVDMGIQYLQHYLHNVADKEPIIAEITRHKLFWNWWRNHWQLRDEFFLIEGIHQQRMEIRIALYLDVNDARKLAHEVYPSGKTLGLTYSSMMGKLIDQTTQKVA